VWKSAIYVLSFFLISTFWFLLVSAFTESHKSLNAYRCDDAEDWIFNKLITRVIRRPQARLMETLHTMHGFNISLWCNTNQESQRQWRVAQYMYMYGALQLYTFFRSVCLCFYQYDMTPNGIRASPRDHKSIFSDINYLLLNVCMMQIPSLLLSWAF
jgi:hypothetical protein